MNTQLATVDRQYPLHKQSTATRNAHILIAIGDLNAVWNGEYDENDNVDTLRRTAQRLDALADAIHSHGDADGAPR